MQLYLDHIANVWVDTVRRNERENGVVTSDNTAEVFRSTVFAALDYGKMTDLRVDTSAKGETAWFCQFILPFAQQFPLKRPLAISLDMGVDLRVPECAEAIHECADRVVAEHSTVYIDIPEGEYMLPGHVFQVRALFIRRFPEGNRFCAILTRPGSKSGWRFAWLEGRHERNADRWDLDDVWPMQSEVICDRYRPINAGKIDYSEFAEVEKVAWAALAQWRRMSEAEIPEQQVAVPEPLVARAQPLTANDEVLVEEEVFTLFKKVRPYRVRLDNRSIKRLGTRKKETKPRANHDVKGFRMWQPYGPGRSLRKLIWREPQTRGHGPRKTPVDSVTPNFG
jgi:hypothetical protein